MNTKPGTNREQDVRIPDGSPEKSLPQESIWNQVLVLMREFDDSSLTELSLGTDDFSVRMKKEFRMAGTTADAEGSEAKTSGQKELRGGTHTRTAPQNQSESTGENTPNREESSGGRNDGDRQIEVKAPLAGVFYHAAKPGAVPYIAVGTHLNKGDTAGLLEAMKLMNEVKAPVSGTVTSIQTGDGEFAEYGRVLFVMQEDPDHV